MNPKKLVTFNLILFAIIIFFSAINAQAQEYSSLNKTENTILKEDIDNDGDIDKVELQLNEAKTQVILSVHVNIGNDIFKKSRQIGYINNVSEGLDYQIFKDKYKRTLILFGKKHNGNEINLKHSRVFKLPKF